MRRYRLIWGLLCCLGSLFCTPASALSLGEIRVYSILNQPLDAEIALSSLRPGEIDTLFAKLASEADFKRAGVERHYYLTKLKFELAIKLDGSPYIQITTDKPVKEPFLNFLIDINSPHARLIREYAVIIDPPSYGPPPVKEQQGVSVAEFRGQIKAVNKPISRRRSADTEPTSIRRQQDDDAQTKQRLAELQNQIYAAEQQLEQKQQRIAALEERIETLMSSSRVETKSDILPIELPPSINSETQINLEEKLPAADDKETTEYEAQSTSDDIAAADDVEEIIIDDIENELNESTQEFADIDEVNSEIQDLSSDDISGENSDELLSTAQNNNESELTDISVAKAEPSNKQYKTVVTANTGYSQKSLLDTLTDWRVLLGAIAILLILVFIGKKFSAHRNLKAKEVIFADLSQYQNKPKAPAQKPAPITPQPDPITPPAEAKPTTEQTDKAIDQAVSDATIKQNPAEPAIDQSVENAESIISEANVYLSYGLLDQAEELVESALPNDPDNLLLQGKLLETYFSAKKVEKFKKLAMQIHQAVGSSQDETWDKAVAMGKELTPELPLFKLAKDSGLKISDFMPSKEESAELDLDIGQASNGDAPNDAVEFLDLTLGDGTIEEFEDIDEGASSTADKDDHIDNSLDDQLLDAFTEDNDDETQLIATVGDDSISDETQLLATVDDSDDTQLVETVDSKIIGSKPPSSEGGLEDTSLAETLAFAADDFSELLGVETADTAPENTPIELDDPGAVQPETSGQPGDETQALQEIAIVADDPDDTMIDAEDADETVIDSPEPAAVGANEDAAGTDEMIDLVDSEDAQAPTSDNSQAIDASNMDEIATRLNLAKAFLDMNDYDNASEALEEVIAEGTENQQSEAKQLLELIPRSLF